MRKHCFMLFGSDARQNTLAQILRTDGNPVYQWPKDCIPDASAPIAILPMPLYDEENRLRIPDITEEELLRLLQTAKVVIGGRISPEFRELAAQKNIKCIDYVERDDFAITNALITAEAALAIAMENRSAILCGSRALVIGYGRIGQSLARLLHALDVRVTVSARKSADFARIRSCGYACTDTRALNDLSTYDVIFNTVPALVLDRALLEQVRKDALLIDLASTPGGIDRYAATMLGHSVIWALSLPGKYAPDSAARTSADSIYAILSEENYEE